MDEYRGYETLKFERADGVLTVTLSPGSPVNALNGRMHTELSTVLSDIRLDEATEAVVLTGEGRAFCAGADLPWLRDASPAERDALFAEGRRIVLDLLEVPQPVIGAIEGPAIGFGATLALLCDIKVAAENATIGDPHVSIGLVAGDGGAVIWPWLVGAGRAKRYLMTGDLMTGVEAERIGLVEDVVPAGEALARAQKLARRLARGHRLAIRGTKASVNKLLRDAANQVLDTSLALEKECMNAEGFPAAVDGVIAQMRKAR